MDANSNVRAQVAPANPAHGGESEPDWAAGAKAAVRETHASLYESPANPAQVTGFDAVCQILAELQYEGGGFRDRDIEPIAQRIFAAIGAGGQAVAVKPLEWEEDHGIAGMGPYRLFKAETPLGRFVYGTDAEGSAYYHTASSGVMMVGNEATAKRLAEAAWEKTALAEVGKFVDPTALSQPHPADERVVEALRIAHSFIAREYRDEKSLALEGEFVSKEARPVFSALSEALAALTTEGRKNG